MGGDELRPQTPIVLPYSQSLVCKVGTAVEPNNMAETDVCNLATGDHVYNCDSSFADDPSIHILSACMRLASSPPGCHRSSSVQIEVSERLSGPESSSALSDLWTLVRPSRHRNADSVDAHASLDLDFVPPGCVWIY